MKKIIKQIIKGDLCRNNDEVSRKGFWDKVGIINNRTGNQQINLCYAFWETYEETTKQILEAQNEKLRKISPLGTYTALELIKENEKLIDDIRN